MRNAKTMLAVSLGSLLIACGGGGGGGTVDGTGPVTSALSFDLDAAMRTNSATGQSYAFDLSSSNGCEGSGTVTTGPANTSSTFESRAVLSATTVWNINYTNCTPAVISSTTVNYFDQNFSLL